jgi:Flp pilus assembly pilin Flp
MLEILMAYMRPFLKREDGQALVEYALILFLVSIAAVGTLSALGTSVDGVLSQVVGNL